MKRDKLRCLIRDLRSVQIYRRFLRIRNIPFFNVMVVHNGVQYYGKLNFNESLSMCLITPQECIGNGFTFTRNSLLILREDKFKGRRIIIKLRNDHSLLTLDFSNSVERNYAYIRIIKIIRSSSVREEPTPVIVEETPTSNSHIDTPVQEMRSIVSSHFDIGLNKVYCVYTGDLKMGLVSFSPFCGCLNTSVDSINIAEFDNNPSYMPEINELCLVKYENFLYRATVLEENSEYFNVLFVDKGSTAKIKCDDIREIPDEFASSPACAAVCKLIDLLKDKKEIESPILEKLASNLLLNRKYEIDVLSEENGIYNIAIPKITDILMVNRLL